MAQIREIVFNCTTPPVLARFWAAALEGYAVRAYTPEDLERLAALDLTPETDPIVVLDGPGPSLRFQNIEGQRHENNRVHFDIDSTDRAATVAGLLELGASVVSVMPGYTVLCDPEANQFCVLDAETRQDEHRRAA